jgi:glutamine amidotransferase
MATTPQQIAIVDFGMGNLYSVCRKLEQIGACATVTSDPAEVRRADKIVLPGVGHFGQAMENLRALGLLDALHEAARVRQVPILGICLGMQLMAKQSEEGAVDGLGWVDASVARFRVPDPLRYKVPHVGWGRVNLRKESALLKGVPDGSEFYFVHSYSLETQDENLVLCDSEYAHPFPSAIQQGNLFGVQFHPEKSHRTGERILENFVEL